MKLTILHYIGFRLCKLDQYEVGKFGVDKGSAVKILRFFAINF